MAYIAKQDLIERGWERELVQLTDEINKPATTINDVTVERACQDASAFIDSYVGKLYRLPLTAVPDVLPKFAADIARYYLHGKAAEKDGPIERAYRDAHAWLKDVAKGVVGIAAEGVTPAQAGGGSVRASAPGRVFTRDSLRDY